MKKLFLFTTIMMIATTIFAQVAPLSEDELIMPDKNPALAFLFSAALPGLGQIYNDEVNTGFILMGGVIVSSTIFYIFSQSNRDEYIPLTLTGLLGASFCYVYSIIDATYTASKITNENMRKRALMRRKYNHAYEYDINNSTFGVDLGSTQNGMILNLSYHF